MAQLEKQPAKPLDGDVANEARSPKGHWIWLEPADKWVLSQEGHKAKAADDRLRARWNAGGAGALGAAAGAGVVAAGVSATNKFLSQQRGDSTAAAGQRAAAEVSRRQQIRATEDAQRHAQIANRDARVEGDKDAAASAASQYRQKMAQLSASAGGGAASLASMNTQDPSQAYQQHRARADTQRERGEEVRTQAERAEQNIVAQNVAADQLNEQAAQDAAADAAATGLASQRPAAEPEGPFVLDLGDGRTVTFTRDEALEYIRIFEAGGVSSPKEGVPLDPTYVRRLKSQVVSDTRTKRIIKVISRRY